MERVQIFGPVGDTREDMKRLQDAMNHWLSEHDSMVDVVDRKFGYTQDKITAALYYRQRH